jgi:hypothetical protein
MDVDTVRCKSGVRHRARDDKNGAPVLVTLIGHLNRSVVLRRHTEPGFQGPGYRWEISVPGVLVETLRDSRGNVQTILLDGYHTPDSRL